jgi:uncharacterized protein (TIRG00374 family)
LKFAVALGLIWLLFQKDLLDWTVLRQLTDPSVLAIGLSLVGVSLAMQSWRWLLLLKARGLPVTQLESWRLYLIGIFFNYALPGSIGGDVVRAYYIAQDHRERRMEAVLTVVIDRLLGLYAMMVIGAVAVLWNWERINDNAQLASLGFATLGVFAFMTVFWAASFSNRVKRWLKIEEVLAKLPKGEKLVRAYQSAQAYRGHKSALIGALVLSVAAQFLTIAFMVLVGHTIGEGDVSLATYLFAVPLGSIIASIPIAPAGLGVGQVAFLVLFQMYSGRASLLGQTAVTAFQLALFAWGMLGVVFYLGRKRRSLADMESMSS